MTLDDAAALLRILHNLESGIRNHDHPLETNVIVRLDMIPADARILRDLLKRIDLPPAT